MHLMYSRGIGSAAIGAALIAALATSATSVPTQSADVNAALSRTPSLNQLVAHALARHPDFAALDAEQRGAFETIGPAGAWPDPQVMIGVMNVSATDWTVGTEPMAQLQLQVTQRIPRPSTLRHAREIAERDVSLAAVSIETRRNRLAADVARAGLDLYHLDERIAIEQTIVNRYREMNEAAEARATVGSISGDELTSVSLEMESAEAKLMELRDRRPAIVAEVNALVNRPVGAPIDRVIVGNLAPIPPVATDLIDTALVVQPDLVRGRIAVERAEANRRLVDALRIPDPAITAAYAWRGEMDGVYSVSAGISLPIQMDRTRNARVRQAAAMVEARQRILESAERDVIGRVDALVLRLHANAELLARYQSTLIPRAENVVEARLAGYAVGRTSLLAVLDAVRRLEYLHLEALGLEVTQRKLTITLQETLGSAAKLAVVTPFESDQ